MTKFSELVFSNERKRDMLFQTAINSSNQIQSFFKLYREGEFDISDLEEQKAFQKIYEKDPKSPAIYWITTKKGEPQQYLIRYPSLSTPYHHFFQDKCKFVECLTGIVYDKNSNKKLFPGDKIKLFPDHHFVPFTKENSSYLRVVIDSCDKDIEDVL